MKQTHHTRNGTRKIMHKNICRMEQKKLFLLDAYALIFRSFYAFITNPMYNSEGLNTSAIYGFVITLDEVLRNQNPDYIGVVFDPPGPTFRNDLYTEYKANREETPEDIKKSIPIIKRILEAYNIDVIEIPGFEADDVIGTLAGKASEAGFDTYMMTPDKDFGQLVSERIRMYKPGIAGKNAEILGIQEIKEKYGIDNPLQVIDILALMGDASDNIPGVPGVGPKTAEKLIKEFISLENLYNNVDKLKGKLKEKLINNKENAEMSKVLATIRMDVPVELNENNLKRREINLEKIIPLYEKLGFKTLKEKLIGNDKKSKTPFQQQLFGEQELNLVSVETGKYDTIETIEHEYIFVNDELKQNELLRELERSPEFCFDTETSGLSVINSELAGIAFSMKPHHAWYLPLPGKKELTKEILQPFKPFFEDDKKLKIGQNLKFDISILKNHDITVNGTLFDTMLAHYLIQPEERHNMDYLSQKYLSYKPIPISELMAGTSKKEFDIRKVGQEKIFPYAAEDADVTFRLREPLEKELIRNNLVNLFYQIETPLVKVLVDMEMEGVQLNTSSLAEFANDLEKEIARLEKEIFILTESRFNISSPKQLGEILFDKMAIVSGAKKTKSKQYSTSEEVLIKIRDKHPVIVKILEYRSLKKLLNTYVEALPKLINQHTSKIHTTYNQTVVATGRLSSNNPNLQNIPIREERGREIRKAFISSFKGGVILSADYSQIELRIMAHLSGDEGLIEAFRNNVDIHTATAAKIFNVPVPEVTREMRSKAKTANFGIIYGISAFGLSQRLDIPRAESSELIEGYFRSYPKVKEFMNQSIQRARDKGYVETIRGRRRFLKDINSVNGTVRGFAERNAINAPIQGTAADIIKIAMVSIHKRLEEAGLQSKMILQVHDELVFDVPRGELEIMKELVRLEMENAEKLDVPLVVDMGWGENWLEAH